MIVLPLVVPLILYVLLSLPSVQKNIAHSVGYELTALLGTDVHLGEVTIAPFNRVVINNVSIKDNFGVEALKIDHLGAGISLWESLWAKRPLISFVELGGLDLTLYKDSVSAPLNIQPIIDRFKSDGQKKSTTYDLAVNLVVIRQSTFSFDVHNIERGDSGRFDKNHVRVTDLRADITIPVISNKQICVDVKRLAANEQSGLRLIDFTTSVIVDSSSMSINNFLVKVGESRLALNDMTLISPLSEHFDVKNIMRSPLASLPESYLILSDLSPFVKEFEGVNERLDIDFEVDGNLDSIKISRFELELLERKTRLSTHGTIDNLTRCADSIVVDLQRLNIVVNASDALGVMARSTSSLHSLYVKLKPFSVLNNVNLLGDLSLTPVGVDFNGTISTACGNFDVDGGVYQYGRYSPLKVDGRINATSLNPSLLMPQLAAFTNVDLIADADLSIWKSGQIDGGATLSIPNAICNGYKFTNITAKTEFEGDKVETQISSTSPYLDFSISGEAELKNDDENPHTEFYADIRNLSFAPFVPTGKFKDFSLSGEVDMSINGRNPDTLIGWTKVSNLLMEHTDGSRYEFPYIEVDASNQDSLRLLTLHSPQADAELFGQFSLKTIGNDVRNIVSSVYPSLVTMVETNEQPIDCKLDLTIKEDTTLSRLLKLPVDLIYPAKINSYAKGGENPMFGLIVDVPFLQQKNKLIENSAISLLIDGGNKNTEFIARTVFPTKEGKLNLNVKSIGHIDSISTGISWVVDREKVFKGNIDFYTNFSRDEESGNLLTDVCINRSNMVFNDSTWVVNPSQIHIAPGRIAIDNLNGGRRGQSLSINGIASADSADYVVMQLENIDLDYIFESLNLSDAVQFGGRATGDFYGLSLLSGNPIAYTPRLKVDGLKYNKCVMGDADIRSQWDHENKSILIDAEIRQKNNDLSIINGYIKPMTEELDFNFTANNAPVGFMAPFMSAFTSKIAGRVSGDAHLYGTFKNIDMTGDIFVDDISMKLDFTNTTYLATDSVHIRPGRIHFDDVVLRDSYGQEAKLSGYVTHNYFHDAAFNFEITDANDFLVYDINENQTEDPWYGKVFGNGKALVRGVPGHVDISVDMTSARKSTFTFVLSDAEQALDYTFITLRDRDSSKKDTVSVYDPRQLILDKMKERMKRDEVGQTSYALSFNVGINTDAAINIIMDPIGGDKITSYGNGNFRMTYTSDGDMKMYGVYTINRGKYNFTLQDIIIKDFEIRDGSRISFLGDPYAAQLDLTASYSTNANLSDLDESFLEDRELNRTNVRVDALMLVRGDIRQPEITFDLDFPSLSDEIHRKVRSIVSTEDMMNRQIIYLLALNKFYTPDYMTGTHGNELVSVASSTLSSRLGSMLGQLSDNWSIAPAIRSDRGDFSDVEVDVALSSHLLNNRLLLNGNLGYRDKSLNNNSFIGDFDIRYLLNRSGTLQLKAYNRYNDQNYYLKSALTTQGVGIVIKRDFDNIFSFLRKYSKGNNAENKAKENNNQTEQHQQIENVMEKRRRISTDSIFSIDSITE